MNYYIIAGEASGDLHASNLMKELKKRDRAASFRCWGGDRMRQEGGVVVKHYRELAFMGFQEVIFNLRTILRNIDLCKKDILANRPEALILVDYPGFNLRIAKFARHNNLRVFYYISPQVWAWKKSRVHAIKKNIDKMFVILPFEKEFYKSFDYDVEFPGHPLLDEIQGKIKNPQWKKENGFNDKPIVALLPGSRKQEISKILPLMLPAVKQFPDYRFVIAAAPSVPDDFYKSMITGSEVHLIKEQTYSLLEHSVAAVVTSGTATLETALFGVPEVVCYKGSRISFAIAKMLVNVKYISLVNLIMEREVVKELIQDQLTPEAVCTELKSILEDAGKIKQIKNEYSELRGKLGGTGASARTAEGIINYLK